MNDHDLGTALRALHVERTQIPDPPALHDRVQALPFDDISQRRSWLPRFDIGRFQSMFSATKFVVAGAIVALFGGFLLAGVLTQPSEVSVPAAPTDSPAPTTTEELLSGMVTEVIEPGVYRVLRDGVRQIVGSACESSPIVPEMDGGVLVSPCDPALPEGSGYRLGGDEVDFVGEGLVGSAGIAGDCREALGRPMDGDWVVGDASCVTVIALADDMIMRDAPDGPESFRDPKGAPEGVVPAYSAPADSLWRPYGVGADGTMWWPVWDDDPAVQRPLAIARLDDAGWSTFEIPASAPFGRMVVAPDGGVWLGSDAYEDPQHSGVYRFDGSAWTRFLPDLIATDGAIAPDGSLWIWAWPSDTEPGAGEEPGGLHVITPAALASAERLLGEPPSEIAIADTTDDTPTTPDLLTGVDLVTEEVEPGVYRVLKDGVRELSILPVDEARYLGGVMDTNIAAGPDGSMWLFGLDGFFRLGEEARHGWHDDFRRDVYLGQADFEVGPDGTIWLHHWLGVDQESRNNGNIWSYDGEAWTTRRDGAKNEYLYGFEVQQDGTVWTAWHTDAPTGKNKPRQRVTAARLGADGWEELPGTVSGGPHGDIVVSGGGGDDLWLMPDSGGRLRRHDGSGWVVQRTPEAGGEMRAAAGVDGTLWVRLHPECGPGTVGNTKNSGCWGPSAVLARYDGGAWEVFRPNDGIPMMGDHYMGFEGFFEVAPDRSIWLNPIGDNEHGSECDGIANFDGQVLRRYLRDHCITAMDMAPDGTVWLRAMEHQPDGSERPERTKFEWLPNEPVHLYVITPEAEAATE